MRIRSKILNMIHLDNKEHLLTLRAVRAVEELFKLLDVHEEDCLNDLVFYHYMKYATDLTKHQIYLTFDMLDLDGSGTIDFDEFYLLACILVAVKDGQDKQFIYRHSQTVFNLLDEDGSNSISAIELKKYGFLFNLQKSKAINKVFREFDISGDMELNYNEFRMFAMAAIDRQHEMERELAENAKEKKANDKAVGLMRRYRRARGKDRYLTLDRFLLQEEDKDSKQDPGEENTNSGLGQLSVSDNHLDRGSVMSNSTVMVPIPDVIKNEP